MRISLIGTLAALAAGVGLSYWPGISRANLWLVLAYSVSGMLMSLTTQFLRAIGKTGMYTLSTLAQTLVILVCNIIFLLVLKLGVSGYVLAYTLGNVTALAFSYIVGKLWKYNKSVKLNEKLSRELVVFSLPLMLNALCYFAITSTSMYFIEYFRGKGATGVFTAANKIPPFLVIINSIFILAWQMSANLEYGQKDYPRFVGRVNAMYQSVYLMCGATIITLTKPIAAIMYRGEDFSGTWQHIPILVFGTTVFTFGQFLGVLYTASGKTVMAFVTNGAAAVVSLAAGWLLTMHFGIFGACAGLVITYLVFWLLRAFTLRKEIEAPKWGRPVLYSGLVFVALTAVITWDFPYAFYTGLALWGIMLALNFKVLLKMADWGRRNLPGMVKKGS